MGPRVAWLMDARGLGRETDGRKGKGREEREKEGKERELRDRNHLSEERVLR